MKIDVREGTLNAQFLVLSLQLYLQYFLLGEQSKNTCRCGEIIWQDVNKGENTFSV